MSLGRKRLCRTDPIHPAVIPVVLLSYAACAGEIVNNAVCADGITSAITCDSQNVRIGRDVVIDCCAGSGSTLRAAWELGRKAYGFEVDRKFYQDAVEQMLSPASDTSEANTPTAITDTPMTITSADEEVLE